MSDWKSHVLPHGPLVQIAPRLWTVEGRLRTGSMPRRMAVWRMDDGGVLVHSAIAMDDAGQAQLDAIGPVRAIVVPNGFHRMDCGAYKARYPAAKVYAPAAARAAVQKVVPVDADIEAVAPDLGVRVLAPDGVKRTEYVYDVDTGDGRGWVLCDAMMNLPDLPGVEGWLLRTIGSTGFFGMTAIGRLLLLRDRAAFKGWLLQRAAEAPRFILPGHGAVVDVETATALRVAADRL